MKRSDHPDVAGSLNNLGGVLQKQGEQMRLQENWNQARAYVQQALRFTRRLGSDSKSQELLRMISSINQDERSHRERRSR